MTLNFPALNLRKSKGAPLTNDEVDSNFTSIKAYAVALAKLIAGSVNEDGTLLENSVGPSAIQRAAVTLASLNPSLLYQIIPVDNDAGTQPNTYVITARGGLGGTNLVPADAEYDDNGNYSLSGLLLNNGYYWTKGDNDITMVAGDRTVTANGAITANADFVLLTGTPKKPVTATLVLSAPISAYKDNQIFFIYTQNGCTGPSTLNVNNLGAIPIEFNGEAVSNQIGSKSVFGVIYKNGIFVLFSGGGSGSGSDVVTTHNYTGISTYTTGSLAIPGANTPVQIAHGLGQVPNRLLGWLNCKVADVGFTAGQSVPIDLFQIAGAPAFFYSADSINLYILQGDGTPEINGQAIDVTAWEFVLNAEKQTNIATTILPALSYSFASPEGAATYDGNLMVLNYGKIRSKTYANSIDLHNSRVSPLDLPSAGTPRSCNMALFTRASGLQDYIFTSSSGLYRIPVVNPKSSIVPRAILYDAAGYYTLTVTDGASYTWTAGSNDAAYSINGGSTFITTPTFTGPVSGSIILKGSVKASVTAQVVSASDNWKPIKIWSNTGYREYKPVWITESSDDITEVYAVSSDNGQGDVGTLQMVKITGSSGATTYANKLNLTNASIANSTDFRAWHPTGTDARVWLFQYNPLLKRIYVVTSELAMLHIFEITGSYGTGGNDITAFWTDTDRHANLKYVRSIAVAGTGSRWNEVGRSHYYVEIDQNSGQEKNIVMTREGDSAYDGSVTIIPWLD